MWLIIFEMIRIKKCTAEHVPIPKMIIRNIIIILIILLRLLDMIYDMSEYFYKNIAKNRRLTRRAMHSRAYIYGIFLQPIRVTNYLHNI